MLPRHKQFFEKLAKLATDHRIIINRSSMVFAEENKIFHELEVYADGTLRLEGVTFLGPKKTFKKTKVSKTQKVKRILVVK